MTTPEDIGWGKYKAYEGPHFKGIGKFQLPLKPTEEHRLLAVITSTEGGSASAINMYDRCALSAGFLQWCEVPYFLTSKLLGAIVGKDPNLLRPLQPALKASDAQFVEKSPGKWRFFWREPYGEVDDGVEQKKLFLLNSTGHQGSWDEESKAHAKLWAASVANVLAQDAAMEVQTKYTASRVKMFATPAAAKILFDGTPSTGWTGATRAIFLSFAANLPAAASTQLQAAVAETGAPKWSKEWCIHIARRLTFGPGIAIYPHRYNAIRPVVEKLYGVDLPDMAGELQVWKGTHGLDDVHDSEVMNEDPEGEPTFTTVKEVQRLLVDMGYDLGPAGADGVMGRKTKEALMVFQGNTGLKADGMLGPQTRAAMVTAWRDKVCV
jgi:hypothetical protein